MHVSEFEFTLPEELIAQDAVARGTSRLLVLDPRTGERCHASFVDLPSYLRAGDLLVVNNTRVVPARLLGRRMPSGGAVECLLLGFSEREHHSEIPAHGPVPTAPRIASALMHPGQKLKPGALVRFEGAAGVLMAEVLERHFHGRRTIRLWAESNADVETLVDALGHVPLPPYIRRSDTAADRERYQTVFARVRGSIAAPTAGLHFTPALLESLDRAGIERAEITLHVGYGTFKPVRTERIEDHVVDPEHYDISVEAAHAIDRARAEGRRVIAVGTTTTRALEDAAARGGGRIAAGPGVASLFIYPGHCFAAIEGLLTNFHLPGSSLLMLAAAFAGRENLLGAYREAVDQRYRFYSYGDAMLIVSIED
jgi:S-adenosylmethionine:tRNA ribosyltransferase-isomerase